MKTERDAKVRTPSDDPVVNRHQGSTDTLPPVKPVALKHYTTPQGAGPGEVRYPAEKD